MSRTIEQIITALKAAAHEEIMFRESGDTSDKWQDDATPENVLKLVEALSAKQSEPDYYIVRLKFNDGWGDELVLDTYETKLDAIKSKSDHGGDIIPVYTTPPANSLVIPEGWIKCSDRMPESSTDVSLFHPEIGVFNGYCWRGLSRDKKPEFFSNSGEHEDGLKPDVTHWMPLPAAPEKPL